MDNNVKIKFRIVSEKTLKEFCEDHADATAAVQEWTTKVKAAEWNQFADIKQTFNTVDYVKNDRYVFNIRGNDYRIVALILFKPKLLYIRFIGTHAEYNEIDCSTI